MTRGAGSGGSVDLWVVGHGIVAGIRSMAATLMVISAPWQRWRRGIAANGSMPRVTAAATNPGAARRWHALEKKQRQQYNAQQRAIRKNARRMDLGGWAGVKSGRHHGRIAGASHHQHIFLDARIASLSCWHVA